MKGGGGSYVREYSIWMNGAPIFGIFGHCEFVVTVYPLEIKLSVMAAGLFLLIV